MSYSNLALYIFFGLFSITIVATAGAIASRKFKFKYVYLSVLSVVIYLLVGYLVDRQFGLWIAISVNGLLGLYDGTVGLKLCMLLKANVGNIKEEDDKKFYVSSAITMVIMAVLLTVLAAAFN